jgi:lysophospholipase
VPAGFIGASEGTAALHTLFDRTQRDIANASGSPHALNLGNDNRAIAMSTDLVSLARNPVPSGAVVGMFQGHDGTKLRFARWEPTRAPRRGTVCVFPGRGEFIEKYFEVVSDLRRRGFAVAIHDWRGQGGSARALDNPRKGYVRSFADYGADLTLFMRDVVLPNCPSPYIALAHSMGGNVLLHNATASDSWFDRMVLTAPMIAIADEKLGAPLPLVRFYAELLGWGPVGRLYVRGGSDRPEELRGFENNPLTSDAERFRRTQQLIEVAPHLALGSPTIAWLRAALRSCRSLMRPEFALGVQVPVLFVAAGNDRIVSPPAIDTLASFMKIGARVSIAGSRHEILQERDEIRQRFWAAFDAYLGVNAAAA